jgi:hypothetical protein
LSEVACTDTVNVVEVLPPPIVPEPGSLLPALKEIEKKRHSRQSQTVAPSLSCRRRFALIREISIPSGARLKQIELLAWLACDVKPLCRRIGYKQTQQEP